jgi:hypothetical protein
MKFKDMLYEFLMLLKCYRENKIHSLSLIYEEVGRQSIRESREIHTRFPDIQGDPGLSAPLQLAQERPIAQMYLLISRHAYVKIRVTANITRTDQLAHRPGHSHVG